MKRILFPLVLAIAFAFTAAGQDSESILALREDGELVWDTISDVAVTDTANIVTLSDYTIDTSYGGGRCSIDLTIDDVFYLRDAATKDKKLASILSKIAPHVRLTVSFGIVEDE